MALPANGTRIKTGAETSDEDHLASYFQLVMCRPTESAAR